MAYTVAMDSGVPSGILTKGRIAVAAGVGLVLVLCFVFIGLYATAVKDQNNVQKNTGNAAAQTGGNPTVLSSRPTTQASRPTVTSSMPTVPSNQNVCKTIPCLESTINTVGYMDTTADPCEDFYTYSCGKWVEKNPRTVGRYTWTTFSKLYADNDIRLRSLLNSASIKDYPWLASKKARDIYRSCTSGTTRLRLGANPFIEKILPHVGGWSVMNDLPDDWNISMALKKIHVDFMTNALFRVSIAQEYIAGSPRSDFHPIIRISDSQLGMGYYYYTSSYFNSTRNAYKAYMKRTAELIARDAHITTNQTEKIETFVDDVFTFETAIAGIMRRYYRSYRSRVSAITLTQLNDRTNNTIDWVDFMSYLLSDANINTNTRVTFSRSGYIEAVFNYISGLPSASRHRMLSNFLVWQLVFKYTEHLSEEYINAFRKYRSTIYGYVSTPSNDETCFSFVKQTMDVALNHMYTTKHSSDIDKTQAQEIAAYIKQDLVNGIDGYTFMDNATKTLAKTRLGQVEEEIGFPDWLSSRDIVDGLYHTLVTSPNDYFQNMLNLNVYEKLELNRQYTGQDKEFDLHWNIYDQGMSFDPTEMELLVPVGVLQKPIFNSQYQKYYNYGALGANLADTYINAIDNYRRFYYRSSSSWWSSTTRNNFTSALDCIGNYYENKTIATYTDSVGRVRKIKISKYSARSYAQRATTAIGGVKHAYHAYKAWQKKNGEEKATDISNLTRDQMFFIAYGQTQCSAPGYFFTTQVNMKVNAVMAHTEDFSKAFNCSAKSSLNLKNKCTTF